MQQMRESDVFGQNRSKSQSPTPRSRNGPKPELFPVWTGLLAPTVTYVKLHELFSRAGAIYSIKMLLEQQCAFVNYTRKEDCDKAIQCINGMIFEGAPLTVRYPYKVHPELGGSKLAATDRSPRPSTYKKECFFWRTTGCTRDDCTFRHVPEHKNIDRDKFTSRLGLHSAIQKWSRQWEARGVSFDLTPWSWHPLFCLFVCLFVFCFCFLSLFWFTTKKVYFELFIIRFW